MGHECRRTRRHAYVLPARRGARLRCVCGIVGPSVERHGVCWRWCRWMCAPWLACIDEGDSTMVLSACLSVIYPHVHTQDMSHALIYARVNSNVYAHVYAHVDVCIDVCMDVCIDVCIDMCMYMCIGTFAGMCIRHVCRHAYRYIYTHVHGRVLNNAAKDCA